MYCRKLRATFFSKWCIYYQEKALELFNSKSPLGRLSKCLNNGDKFCRQGKIILKEYPEPALDIDVKRLMFEYKKIVKFDLIKKITPKLKLINTNKIKKYNLKKEGRIKKYTLKKDEENNICHCELLKVGII